MSKFSIGCLVAIAAMVLTSRAGAYIIFDDFDTDQGHYGATVTFSTQTNVASTSSFSRNATDGVDSFGSGHMLVNWVVSATSPARIRWDSGGPPFDSTHVAAPLGNTTADTLDTGSATSAQFAVSNATTDGWAGFYFKTTTSGETLSLNLDDVATNAGANMTGGIPKTVTAALADGNWHLFEWNLDNLADWGAVASIGGSNANLEGKTHSIDSVYIQSIPGASGSTGTIAFDFFAKSDSGTIAALVPEPASLSLFALAGLGLVRRRRN